MRMVMTGLELGSAPHSSRMAVRSAPSVVAVSLAHKEGGMALVLVEKTLSLMVLGAILKGGNVTVLEVSCNVMLLSQSLLEFSSEVLLSVWFTTCLLSRPF